jgi:hypothetical protein
MLSGLSQDEPLALQPPLNEGRSSNKRTLSHPTDSAAKRCYDLPIQEGIDEIPILTEESF